LIPLFEETVEDTAQMVANGVRTSRRRGDDTWAPLGPTPLKVIVDSASLITAAKFTVDGHTVVQHLAHCCSVRITPAVHNEVILAGTTYPDAAHVQALVTDGHITVWQEAGMYGQMPSGCSNPGTGREVTKEGSGVGPILSSRENFETLSWMTNSITTLGKLFSGILR
jgi:hypothetical protein